jgi:MFS family permease
VVFTVASLWCGLSGSAATLIAARVVQGVGAGVLTPQTLSTITRIFPPQRRGVAMSVWGATAGAASLVGPLAGGLLVDGLVGSGFSSSTSRSASSAWRWRCGWSRRCPPGSTGST